MVTAFKARVGEDNMMAMEEGERKETLRNVRAEYRRRDRHAIFWKNRCK